jgi:hypothetical protein
VYLRNIALAYVIVGVIFLILTVADANSGWFLALSVVAIALGGVSFGLIAVEQYATRALVEVVKSNVVLKFEKPDGSLARYTKTHTCRILATKVRSYVERALRADPPGRIEDVHTTKGTRWEDRVTGEEGRRVIEVFFDPPPARNEIIQRELTCSFVDSFLNEIEYFTCTIAHPCKELELTIEAHESRPFRETWLIYSWKDASLRVEGTEAFKLEKNDVGDIIGILFEKHKPHEGEKYSIFWKW